MSRSKRRKSGSPLSTPPESAHIDSTWDELVKSLGEDDEAFDRTTAVPSIPSEAYAKHVMAEAERSERATDPVSKRPGAASDDPGYEGFSTVLPPLPTEPPPPQLETPRAAVESARNTISTLPPPTVDAKGTRRQRAVTRKEQPAVRRKTSAPKSASPTNRPRAGRKKEVRGSEASGLELEPISTRAGTTAAGVRTGGSELKDRYAMGDFSGALAVAEAILEREPDDLEAQRYAQSCRDVLMQMYAERMGSLQRLANVAIPSDQIRWLSLDHRSGFMLSLVDGACTIEEILDICGMPRLDALRILYTLLEQRVISLDGNG